jgi:DNA mismatch repair protein MutS2
MIYPKHFEQKIGFDKIRLLIKNHCISDLGKEIVDEIEFSANFDSVALSMQQTAEFILIIDEGDAFPIDGYFDVRSYLKRIKIEGTFLTESELFEFKRSLFTIKNIINFLESILITQLMFKGISITSWINLEGLKTTHHPN